MNERKTLFERMSEVQSQTAPASCSPDVVADGTLAFALEGADELERLGKAAQSMVGAIPAIIHDDERQRQQSQFHEGEARRWMRLASSVRATADALESMMRRVDAMREALTKGDDALYRPLDYTLFHDSSLVENADPAKQSPIVTACKEALASIRAALSDGIEQKSDAG
jgi:hypothetical protein